MNVRCNICTAICVALATTGLLITGPVETLAQSGPIKSSGPVKRNARKSPHNVIATTAQKSRSMHATLNDAVKREVGSLFRKTSSKQNVNSSRARHVVQTSPVAKTKTVSQPRSLTDALRMKKPITNVSKPRFVYGQTKNRAATKRTVYVRQSRKSPWPSFDGLLPFKRGKSYTPDGIITSESSNQPRQRTIGTFKPKTHRPTAVLQKLQSLYARDGKTMPPMNVKKMPVQQPVVSGKRVVQKETLVKSEKDRPQGILGQLFNKKPKSGAPGLIRPKTSVQVVRSEPAKTTPANGTPNRTVPVASEPKVVSGPARPKVPASFRSKNTVVAASVPKEIPRNLQPEADPNPQIDLGFAETNFADVKSATTAPELPEATKVAQESALEFPTEVENEPIAKSLVVSPASQARPTDAETIHSTEMPIITARKPVDVFENSKGNSDVQIVPAMPVVESAKPEVDSDNELEVALTPPIVVESKSAFAPASDKRLIEAAPEVGKALTKTIPVAETKSSEKELATAETRIEAKPEIAPVAETAHTQPAPTLDKSEPEVAQMADSGPVEVPAPKFNVEPARTAPMAEESKPIATVKLPVEAAPLAEVKPSEATEQVVETEIDEQPEFEFGKLEEETLEDLARIDPEKAAKFKKLFSRGGTGMKGFCPVVLRDDQDLVDANAEIKTTFRGQNFTFSSSEAQQKFEANPEVYAPISGGYDVIVLLASGQEVAGTLDHAIWYKDRLHLFSGQDTLDAFIESIDE